MSELQLDFLRFVVDKNILKFGEYITKFGRKSPYFFNAGLFFEGESLLKLANFYADTIINQQIEFDVLFGPAYKGIVLAAATSLALAQKGINKPYAYNRKEAKDHGEGGTLVGAPLKGNILIIDDVISAGTSVRQSIELIQQEKAHASGVLVALDRMERGVTELSAVQELKQKFDLAVFSIASLDGILELIQETPELKQYQTAITTYRELYGER